MRPGQRIPVVNQIARALFSKPLKPQDARPARFEEIRSHDLLPVLVEKLFPGRTGWKSGS
jgi:hypothetical protein